MCFVFDFKVNFDGTGASTALKVLFHFRKAASCVCPCRTISSVIFLLSPPQPLPPFLIIPGPMLHLLKAASVVLVAFLKKKGIYFDFFKLEAPATANNQGSLFCVIVPSLSRPTSWNVFTKFSLYTILCSIGKKELIEQ